MHLPAHENKPYRKEPGYLEIYAVVFKKTNEVKTLALSLLDKIKVVAV